MLEEQVLRISVTKDTMIDKDEANKANTKARKTSLKH